MIEILAEAAHGGEGGFLTEMLSIATDPAHIVAELLFQVVVDGLIIGLGWKMIIKRYLDRRLAREHAALDAEHGVDHWAEH